MIATETRSRDLCKQWFSWSIVIHVLGRRTGHALMNDVGLNKVVFIQIRLRIASPRPIITINIPRGDLHHQGQWAGWPLHTWRKSTHLWCRCLSVISAFYFFFFKNMQKCIFSGFLFQLILLVRLRQNSASRPCWMLSLFGENYNALLSSTG